MCGHCGCGENGSVVYVPGMATGRRSDDDDGHHPHHHHHPHDHPQHLHHERHHHSHWPEPGAAASGDEARLEARILAANDRLAARNRAFFAGREMLVINLLGAPGAGKTTLLEALLARLDGSVPVLVVEGDQATDRDGARIRAAGAPVVQVNTGTGCHLDAAMVASAVARLAPPLGSWLVIENVGNLVCPALFDLGENLRLVLASPTEGEDKPLKYPHIFRSAHLVLLGKADLLPHLGFQRDAFAGALAKVAPDRPLLEVSGRDGRGLDALIERLHAHHRRLRGEAAEALVATEAGR